MTAIFASRQKLRRVLRAVLERRQQQVQLPLERLRTGSKRDTQEVERPGQVLRCAGERMLTRPRLRRTAPAPPRSPRRQSGVLAPHAQLRVTRPDGMESDHADIFTSRSDAVCAVQ